MSKTTDAQRWAAIHTEMAERANGLREERDMLAVQRDALVAICQHIAALASGWDKDGALGPRHPLSWETVARMAMDYARAALADTPPAREERTR